MKKSRFGIILSMAVILVVTISSVVVAADVHTTPRACVRNKEIRYTQSTWYSSNLTSAINSWNIIKPISIAPDTATTINNLDIFDKYDSGVSWAGMYYYSPYPLTSKIHLNNYYMDAITSNERTHVYAHEIGHALGIGDHDTYSTYHNILMYAYLDHNGSPIYGPTYPVNHDIADYRSLWGN